MVKFICDLFQIEYPLYNSSATRENKKIFNLTYYILAASVASGFIHYSVSIAIIVCGAALFLLIPSTRKGLFSHKSTFLPLAFCLITATISTVYGNWMGLACTGLFASMMTVALTARAYATKKMFENIFSFTILLSYFAVCFAIVERAMNINNSKYRCYSISINPNHFGIMVTLVILLCAYKVANTEKNKYIYYISALFNALGLALSGSLSLWLVTFCLVFLFFLFNKNYDLLAIFTCLAVCIVGVILLFPELMPRLKEAGQTTLNRVEIYENTLVHFKKSPLFGRGFLSYRYWRILLPDMFRQKVSRCHNITLDCLLSHGIVGTLIIETYLVIFIIAIANIIKKFKKHGQTTFSIPLILSALISITLYGMIDTTIIWSQSGIILLMIFATIGIDEKQELTKPKRLPMQGDIFKRL